jgi:two-component system response regulator PilR (NtrC family)
VHHQLSEIPAFEQANEGLPRLVQSDHVLPNGRPFVNEGVIQVDDLLLKGTLPRAPAPSGAVPATVTAPVGGVAPCELPANLPDYLIQIERDIIVRALAQTHYNRTQAAQLLGISFRQLRYQMQKLGIQEPDN